LRLPAPSVPAARWLGGPEVGRLAQIRLAEDDDARGAETADDERVLWRRRPLEGQRPGGRHHPIAGRDVVLDEHRDAVQRTANTAGLALPVGAVRQRVRA